MQRKAAFASDPAYELTARGRTLLQERLATYALVLGVIAVSYWPAFYWIWGADPAISRDAVLSHIVSPGTFALLSVYAVLWSICRARVWPNAWLPRIDVVGNAAIGLAFGQILRTHPSPSASALEGLLAITAVLCLRALLVPSSAARTALAGSLLCLGPGATLLLNGAHFSTPWLSIRTLGPLYVNWAVIAVVISAVSSAVLYGLRRDVRDARRLGHYTLTEKLGEGGMGVVYRAKHHLLRRPTAIKLLPSTERLGSLERFEREVQLMAELSHPNTVAIHDYGRTSDGIFYYVMEHLDGVDLEGLVRAGGPQSGPRTIHILRQICGSLDEAHQRGLIHRDVKPANIFLCRQRSQPDTVKVLDFGLAKDTAATDGRADAELSAVHSVLGTPLYMAPESLSHKASVDARSDLYSLGAVGYFLLTGTPPFRGESVVAVCAQHLHSAPEPPSVRLGRPIAADLERLVIACLAKDPAQRPASAAELGRALDACEGAREWGRDHADAWWVRHRARIEQQRKERGAGDSSEPASFVVAPTRAVSAS